MSAPLVIFGQDMPIRVQFVVIYRLFSSFTLVCSNGLRDSGEITGASGGEEVGKKKISETKRVGP